jgi:FkbM family methyltransferase
MQHEALVLDVGANVGWSSLLAHCTAEGIFQVRAYEPNPRLADLLRRTFSANGLPLANVREVAVGDTTEEVQLAWEWSYQGNGQVASRLPPGPRSHGWQTSTVAQVTLDSDVPPGTRVALIKIDVEEQEPAVIRGARRILDENPDCVLLVEWHDTREMALILQELQERGYLVWHIDEQANLHAVSLFQIGTVAKDADMLYIARDARDADR